MDVRRLRESLRQAGSTRVFRSVAAYIVVSWGILQAFDLFTARFGLPEWFFWAVVVFTVVGFPVISATAYLQDRKALQRREQRREIELWVPPGFEPPPVARRWLTWPRAVMGGVLVFTGLATLGLGIVWERNRDFDFDPGLVAVVPFHTSGEGVDFYREAMVDLIAPAIDGTGDLRATDPRAVLNHWRARAGEEVVLADPSTATEVAGLLGASYVIIGSVVRIGGDRLRVSADLYSTPRRAKIGSTALVEGKEDAIAGLVDRLTIALLKRIWRSEDEPRVNVAGLTTNSVEALRAFLTGEQAFRRLDFEAAEEAFRRAVVADSTFALAVMRLGATASWTHGRGFEMTPQMATLASRHLKGLSVRDSLLILGASMATRGTIGAIPLLERLVTKYSGSPEIWYQLGEAYYHQGMQTGHPPGSGIGPFSRALALDSSFVPAMLHLTELAYYVGDTTAARRWTEHLLAFNPPERFRNEAVATRNIILNGPADLGSFEAHLASQDARTLRAAGNGVFHIFRGPGAVWPRYELIMLELIRRENPEARPSDFLWLGIEYIRRGQAERGFALIDDGYVRGNPNPQRSAVLRLAAGSRATGVANDSISERLVETLEPMVPNGAGLVYIIGEVVEQRGAEVELLQVADRFRASGDERRARAFEGLAEIALGRNAAARDSPLVAAEHLRRGLERMPVWQHWSHDPQRYLLANLVRDRGGEEEALRIYGSLQATAWLEGPGYLARARLHERRGETQAAVRYYNKFLSLYTDPDPHLRDQVQSATRALKRLGAEGSSPATGA